MTFQFETNLCQIRLISYFNTAFQLRDRNRDELRKDVSDTSTLIKRNSISGLKCFENKQSL